MRKESKGLDVLYTNSILSGRDVGLRQRRLPRPHVADIQKKGPRKGKAFVEGEEVK